ncbi:DUF924 domain-containing protein [Exilibacterium tricleocarpae]|uniref:DUF924 domain-containing protein n=1 Tax=Exilibacterium tricleocarpae TaxID=2591008 RepID=A0A545T3R0_9GAMM|nr:DUF924 family protein [Exilibacterium tricleocarpae]TQV71846.1 DUF924 domain-containing protein [Exilibacterium tricleocarpae]
MTTDSQGVENLPVADIVDFWFDDCQRDPGRLAQRSRFWFVEGRLHDETVRQRFGHWIEPVAASTPEALAEPRTCLAAVLVLDQFSRHCYRGQARAFAFDAQALGLLQWALDRVIDRTLHPVEAMFLYMPLQHAEDLACHHRAVQLYEQLERVAPPPFRGLLGGALDSAREHLALIQRFGRFPHRNDVLQRTSSAEEIAYLDGGGKRFGQ